MRDDSPTCLLLRAGETYSGKQGLDYLAGISAETDGARGLCMHLLTVPPGGRARAHMHESHETAIYVLEGEGEMWYGPRLEHRMAARAGDMIYIPAGVPHLPMNRSAAPMTAVIARTDPNEQESVVLLPDLDPLVP
jgi:uncharacterized RmlC-like cupin family protein